MAAPRSGRARLRISTLLIGVATVAPLIATAAEPRPMRRPVVALAAVGALGAAIILGLRRGTAADRTIAPVAFNVWVWYGAYHLPPAAMVATATISLVVGALVVAARGWTARDEGPSGRPAWLALLILGNENLLVASLIVIFIFNLYVLSSCSKALVT